MESCPPVTLGPYSQDGNKFWGGRGREGIGMRSIHHDGISPVSWTEDAQASHTHQKTAQKPSMSTCLNTEVAWAHKLGGQKAGNPRVPKQTLSPIVERWLPQHLARSQKADILKPDGVNAYYTQNSFVAEGTYYNPTPHAKLPIYGNIPCLENTTIQTL